MQVAAQNYFELIVEPTCCEYFERPWDFRLGVLSIIVTSHMVDYWVMEGYEGTSSMNDMRAAIDQGRELLTHLHPGLQALRDAADAAKHGKLATLKATRQITSADQIQVTPGLFHAPFGQGVFAEAMDIYFDNPNGKRVSVRELVTGALKFWRKELGIDHSTSDTCRSDQ
ncbi:hypothetical protein [Stenotrophomonas sp. NPDC077659]|uniref:hypothetical protein n=1 Tax=Stenotrophomonas sp. NPDC077659 TaxID=3390694 RepID=UPI003D06A43B